MGLRRGFKSEAHATAREIRAELGLNSVAPLNPWTLAEHLGIAVVALTALEAAPRAAVLQFIKRDSGAFSAVTVFDGHRRMIVFNDAHSVRRQASDIAHELAHSLLLHEPRPAFAGTGTGVRAWDEDEEDEADWLAGALLVSDEAAVTIARERLPLRDAARLYGVSVRMMQFRLNVTGARKRVERAERYRQNHHS